MSTDISLTASQRLALIDLRQNATLSSRTQRRLSSGRKINSVIDDSVNYFRAKALQDRARDFDVLRAEMAQAIKHLEVTLEAISSLEKILGQVKGILEASRSQSQPERKLADGAIKNLGAQFAQLVQDASYNGANLINSTSMGRTIQFGVRTASRMTLPGLNFINGGAKIEAVAAAGGQPAVAAAADKPGLRVFQEASMYDKDDQFQYSFLFGAAAVTTLEAIGANNSQVSVVAIAVGKINYAINSLRGHAQSLGSNVAILQERERFTESYVTLSTVGAEKYTLADLNEEGANLVALQTRQQLGIQALAVAGQQQRAILTLLQ